MSVEMIYSVKKRGSCYYIAMQTQMKRPSLQLAPYIAQYWLWQLAEAQPLPPIYPGTGVELLINLGDALIVEAPFQATILKGQAVLVCPRKHPFQARSVSAVKLLSLRFRSAGFFQLFGVPLSLLSDQLIDANDILPAGLLTRVISSPSMQSALDSIESALHRLTHEQNSLQQAMPWAIDQIYYRRYQGPLVKMYSDVAMSERSFQRNFKLYTGVSAKYFERTARFQASLKALLAQEQPIHRSQLALAYGYYDQAYFNNEFKHFTGLAPQAYLNKHNCQLSYYSNRLYKPITI